MPLILTSPKLFPALLRTRYSDILGFAGLLSQAYRENRTQRTFISSPLLLLLTNPSVFIDQA